MEKIVVHTKQGMVAGKRSGRFVEFRGIPYGKAKRFCEAKMCRWEEVLDCTKYGKKALQTAISSTPQSKPEPEEHFGEDCLNLNIYTPDVNGSLPVLVDIHGGAFQTGGNQQRTAEEVTKKYCELLKIQNPSELLEMDEKNLLKAQEKLCEDDGNTCIFGPVADGIRVPYNWEALLHSDQYWSGRAIVGSCRNEFWTQRHMDAQFYDHAPSIAEKLFGLNAEKAKESYEKLCGDVVCKKEICDEDTRKDFWMKIFSDYMYRIYSRRLARILVENGSTVYKYSMEYAPALHCQDQSFAFESKDGGEIYQDEEIRGERIRLGHMIFEAYTNFIQTGDPNGTGLPRWDKYSREKYMQMCWDKESKEVPEGEDDILHDFPEQVFRLK